MLSGCVAVIDGQSTRTTGSNEHSHTDGPSADNRAVPVTLSHGVMNFGGGAEPDPTLIARIPITNV